MVCGRRGCLHQCGLLASVFRRCRHFAGRICLRCSRPIAPVAPAALHRLGAGCTPAVVVAGSLEQAALQLGGVRRRSAGTLPFRPRPARHEAPQLVGHGLVACCVVGRIDMQGGLVQPVVPALPPHGLEGGQLQIPVQGQCPLLALTLPECRLQPGHHLGIELAGDHGLRQHERRAFGLAMRRRRQAHADLWQAFRGEPKDSDRGEWL